jgi:molybdopterin-containing oxidoreductase family iron-sulfur binding subunit
MGSRKTGEGEVRDIDRREFLKVTGAWTTVGLLGGWKAVELLVPGEVEAKYLQKPEALTAKRWSMVVDMKKMDGEGAKKCTEVCHRIHNVPDIGDPRREIKWIWLEPFGNAFPGQHQEHIAESLEEKPLIVLCNHCDNPPCVRVCPTKATWKRGDGIVMMDQHRCIGCRFCMAACPFGSRSFNWGDPRPFIKKRYPEYPTREKGVVEKCNFCAERLAKGLMPGCVEVSNGALIFGDLTDPEQEVRKILRTRYSIRRKPHLGTDPQVYYIV